MIVGFRHKGLERLFYKNNKKGVQADHVRKLKRILAFLDVGASPAELTPPAFKLHALKGEMSGHWSIWVNGKWRVTFRFVGADVDVVDYTDYH